jgi:hypothetical protein
LIHIARLQQKQLIFLGTFKGKFNFLVIQAFLVNHDFGYFDQLGINGGKRGFQGNSRIAMLGDPLFFRNGKGFHQAGNNIIALNAEDKIAVKRDIG